MVTVYTRPVEMLLRMPTYGVAADLWGAGLIYYEMLTFNKPFYGNERWPVLLRVIE